MEKLVFITDILNLKMFIGVGLSPCAWPNIYLNGEWGETSITLQFFFTFRLAGLSIEDVPNLPHPNPKKSKIKNNNKTTTNKQQTNKPKNKRKTTTKNLTKNKAKPWYKTITNRSKPKTNKRKEQFS